MSSLSSQCSRAAGKLGDLLARLSVREEWDAVELDAQTLANGLRNRGGPVDEHTALGKTLLPQTLTSLLKAALVGSRVPDATRCPAVFELLRVGANLCLDHDENRDHLLEAGFPQTVLSLLEAYVETFPAIPLINPQPLSTIHLKIVKTAVGVILNSSLGYEPVQSLLISLGAAVTLLRLSSALYPPGAWLTVVQGSLSQSALEDWSLRCSLCEWSWRAISGLKDNPAPLFDAEALPFLIAPLHVFIPPFKSFSVDVPMRHALVNTDVDVLGEVSELLESLSMDVEDVRLALARGMTSPDDHEGQPCLTSMLDFIEHGDYPPYWTGEPAADVAKWSKTMDLCKAAIIKAVVEITGEEKITDVLWDISKAGGGFVSRMIKWLRAYHSMPSSDSRDDLVICSTLSLGNLVRRDNYSETLVKPPTAIVPDLVSLLRPETDLKVKHGVVGLLKHLSQTPSNRPLVGQTGAIESLATSQVFGEKADLADITQVSAIGIAKFLCANSVDNSIILVLGPGSQESASSGIGQILRLVQRSDSVSVKSEGTRVLVNVIKSLCSSTGNLQDQRRQAATKIVTTSHSATALAQLLGRSRKYPTLLNEAIVAMLLLSLQPSGTPLVIDALEAQLPQEAPTSAQSGTSSNQTSPVVSPPTALDTALIIMKNADNRFPAEIRANLCALLAELGRTGNKGAADRSREVQKLKDSTRDVLESTAGSSESLALSAAARKALDAWM